MRHIQNNKSGIECRNKKKPIKKKRKPYQTKNIKIIRSGRCSKCPMLCKKDYLTPHIKSHTNRKRPIIKCEKCEEVLPRPKWRHLKHCGPKGFLDIKLRR